MKGRKEQGFTFRVLLPLLKGGRWAAKMKKKGKRQKEGKKGVRKEGTDSRLLKEDGIRYI